MKRLVFAALIAAVALSWATGAWSSPALGKQMSLTCTICHDKPGSRLLTDRGKYFEVMRTLDGYDDVIADFGACTSCHVKKPGSHKLTRQGQELARVIRNMKDLAEWMKVRHPQPPPPKGPDQAPPAPELLPAH